MTSTHPSLAGSSDGSDAPKRLVVVGGGMVAHRLVEALRDRDADGVWSVDLYCEEAHPPYDRVALTSYFAGQSPTDLVLGDQDLGADPLVTVHLGSAVTAIDPVSRTVRVTEGEQPYDALVLATGSSAFVPPVTGADLPGSFVYRTIEDVQQLEGWVHGLGDGVRGVVVGGGLLGLEAAGALHGLGVATTVVEFADRLMPLQVDEGGGAALRRIVEGMGVEVLTSTASAALHPGADGRVSAMEFGDGTKVDAEVVVFATGVRPRDELARAADLVIGERGGVVVDDGCVVSTGSTSGGSTSGGQIYAIGEVACIQGRTWGLVGPGYTMAEVVVDRLLGGEATFPGADTSTKLKLLGVDVASFGDAFAEAPGSLEVTYADPVAGVYKKLVMSDDAKTLLGGVLVGDASAYASLRPMLGAELGSDPNAWLLPEGSGAPVTGDLPDAANVCSCNNVTAGTIRASVCEGGCTDLGAVKACTKAGTSCGSCLPLVKRLMTTELEKSGIEVSNALCEHFAFSRAQLFDIISVTGLRSFSEIIGQHGTGRGCDICRPVVASILSSLGTGHVLDKDLARLQDTNDHVMANLQKDGTYSVVPRVPAGEITPEGLIAIGQVAADYGLYTKITGGQRIDLFGARLEQLPAIWKRLVEAGFESGHAYGKSLRTVKSCVGSTWCRYGVQDSVGLAVDLELRYRGLRSPHKLKLGVSGCARECAEARGKDVGVIATDNGWNLYVGGNGGFTPRHAQLFAEDLDTEELVRTIDRFLMYYVRTADRLQRTAPWVEAHEGGIEAIREVVMEDSLGICADLDAAMAAHVDSYADEWAATLADPEKLSQFVSFLNAPEAGDPDLTYVTERGQRRPATADERGTLIAGATLEVRS
ncbi:nitrite reductase large subunit [Nocardioides marmoriginsengisoli]|uniref:assimilatory sulfite reductase (ferredoxin) n=1 Tax=Nocardioides marmoriginsengisoli TaxID=661483 RepID=A0A3N0CJZ8_9ACTN|nr:nitrite reductase large subunit NirB [Nocardioides marmoriginsengisoli]RNL63263.1 nitrite reductase large subunit [Nocardioides marmoriginsengisoli]